MSDITPQILILTSWIANCCGKRNEKKEAYKAANNLLYFRPAEAQELSRITHLEEEGYPADEKASPEALRYRQERAGDLFLVAVQPSNGKDNLVGYICGTLTCSASLTHETMTVHDPSGTILCIHSVCVDPSHRRQGIAKRMLQAYLVFVQQTTPQVTAARLLSKEHLVHLYKGAGFRLIGPSSVQHGKEQWIEMEISFPGQV